MGDNLEDKIGRVPMYLLKCFHSKSNLLVKGPFFFFFFYLDTCLVFSLFSF